MSRAGHSYDQNPSSIAITTEPLSAGVLKARKYTHETPLPPRSAQRSNRSPPQTRLCVFDHLPDTRWYSRASSAHATKRPHSPTMKSVTRWNSSERQETDMSIEKPNPPEQEQTWETAEMLRRDQHTILMRADNSSDISSHKVVWPRSSDMHQHHHVLEEFAMQTAERLETAKAAACGKPYCSPAIQRWLDS